MDGLAGGDRMTNGKLAALALPEGRRYHGRMYSLSSRQQSGTTWFVSRHPGAIDWAKRQGLNIGPWVEHLDPAKMEVGDTVIGTLPVRNDNDLAYNLKSLGETARGLFGETWLHSAQTLTPMLEERELQARIKVLGALLTSQTCERSFDNG